MGGENYDAPPRVTDKRGKKSESAPPPSETSSNEQGSDSLPTAQELLDEVPSEAQAKWEQMSEQEKQEILAQQAEALQGTPYSGAGIETETVVPEGADKKEVIAYFAVIVFPDGTAVATDNMDVSGYEPKFPIDQAIMHRACSEIIKDINSTEAALATVRLMSQQAQYMAQQQQARALHQQLQTRGTPVPANRAARRRGR